jgi:hypothetical protein
LLRIRRLILAVLGALLALPAALLQSFLATPASAAVPTVPTQALMTGQIERLSLNNPGDVWSGGTMVLGGQVLTIPANLLIDFPANRLTLQQTFAQAPAACVARGESGLALTDVCNTNGFGGIATVAANRSANGNVIVGDLFIQKGAEILAGVITFMDFNQGYYRVNGAVGSSTTGVMIRMNDPTSRHSVQSGLGCAAGAINCSPDPRFTGDPDNYTNTSTTGYPICIPSTVARSFTDVHGIVGAAGSTVTAKAAPDGSGDVLCPTINRPATAVDPLAGDSRRFAPLQLGDHVTVTGNWETVGTTRFLSVWSTLLSAGLTTSTAPGQPDYILPTANSVDAPPFYFNRVRADFQGLTTDSTAPDVLLWSTHHDPQTGAYHEFPMASVNGCLAVRAACQPRPHQYHIQYHNTFNVPTQLQFSTCAQLQREPRFNPRPCPSAAAGGVGSNADALGVLSPITHEMQYRTGQKLADINRPGGPTWFSIDINGADAKNGQYLFPMGIGLGGISSPIPLGADLVNQNQFPFSFDGMPWNLDRRLSPGGCIGPCDPNPVPLSPFPTAGFDPRGQATAIPTTPYSDPAYTAATLNNASSRILSFVDNRVGNFNGDATVLAWPPADPPATPIGPTPALTAQKGLITSFNPVAGSVGSTVLINGTGLANASNVTFNSVPANSFFNVSPTQVQAVVPVGATSGPISVTTPFGTWFSSSSFDVVPAPAIDGFTPSSGPVGTGVTISGTGFSSATNVAFNGVQAVFSVLSDTAIRTSVPAGATTGSITVTNPGGFDTSAATFTVTASSPSISALTPGTGPVGTSVSITGSNLSGATTVAFNGVGATFSVVSATQITATVPAGATTGTVSVVTPAGTATSPSPFTVTAPAPKITSFSPASGPVGTVVTLTGSGFSGATSAAVNGITATFSVTNDTTMTVTVPTGATTGPITVTTPAGTASSPTNYTVA